MKSRLMFFVFLAVLLSTFSGLAQPIDTASVQVRIEIPALHQMEVVEDVSVSFSPSQLEDGAPLIFRDVGHLAVRSNGDWMVTVGSSELEGVVVYMRPSGDSDAAWQRVDSQQGMFPGARGTHAVRWDVKLERITEDGMPTTDTQRPDGQTVGFAFTISST